LTERLILVGSEIELVSVHGSVTTISQKALVSVLGRAAIRDMALWFIKSSERTNTEPSSSVESKIDVPEEFLS
jgi:hypothetical protein